MIYVVFYYSYIYFPGMSKYYTLDEFCSRQGWRMAEIRQDGDAEQVGADRQTIGGKWVATLCTQGTLGKVIPLLGTPYPNPPPR